MASAWLNISNSWPCAIATSLNPQAPAVLTASTVGAKTAMSIDEAETPQGEVARTGIGAATSGTLRLRHRLTGFRAGRSCRRENAAGSSGSQ